jgi:regulator of sigma E protease
MTTVLAFLFVLGVLVFVHELGHFLVARWHGVRVHTFSLGFGPKLLSFRRGDTEYCVSVIPLGGYVKLAGENALEEETNEPSPMSTTSSASDQLVSDQFMAKSRWVRFQVYVAGPVMNILLAIVVAAVVLSRGADVPIYRSGPPVIGSVEAGSPAETAGLRVGDLLVSLDGASIPTWDEFEMAVVPKAGRELSLVATRGDERISVRVTPVAVGSYEMGDLGIGPVLRPQITQVNPGSPAEQAGLLRGDVLLAVNGARDLAQDAIIERIRASADTPITLTIERAGQSRDVPVTPRGPQGAALIGVGISQFEVRRIDPSVFEAVKLSVQQNWETTLLIGKTLGGLLTRETPVRQLMGPVGIAQLSGSAAELGWVALLNLMAMISLNLGLLNLMPVPVLDGGHIAILAVEGLARRDLSIRVKERILVAGATVMVLLMVTVIYNDIARLIR